MQFSVSFCKCLFFLLFPILNNFQKKLLSFCGLSHLCKKENLYLVFNFNTNRIKCYVFLTLRQWFTLTKFPFVSWKIEQVTKWLIFNGKFSESLVEQIPFFLIFIILGINIDGLPIAANGFRSSPQFSFNVLNVFRIINEDRC